VRGNCILTSSSEATKMRQGRDRQGHERSEPDRQRKFKLRFQHRR
jgi:hypothetical protein